MRKRLFSPLIIIIFCFLFIGCSSSKETDESVQNKISYLDTLYPGSDSLLEIRLGTGGTSDFREYLCTVKVPENYMASFLYLNDSEKETDIFETLGMTEEQTVAEAVDSCILTDADVVPSILRLSSETKENVSYCFTITDLKSKSVELLSESFQDGTRLDKDKNHEGYITNTTDDSKVQAVFNINQNSSLVVDIKCNSKMIISLDTIGQELSDMIIWDN